MSRYNFTGIKIDKNTGNRVLKSTLYPEIRINDGDKFIYPLPGDRLESIAYRYYGDTTLWWIIAKANNISNGTIFLEPGKQLRIPNITSISGILTSMEELNSLY